MKYLLQFSILALSLEDEGSQHLRKLLCLWAQAQGAVFAALIPHSSSACLYARTEGLKFILVRLACTHQGNYSRCQFMATDKLEGWEGCRGPSLALSQRHSPPPFRQQMLAESAMA